MTTNYNEIFNNNKICIIVPTYNNCNTLEKILLELLDYTKNIIVINDGSTDKTKDILDKYTNIITVHNYEKNIGKGYALQQGFKIAIEKGFQYTITIDSDSQHYVSDLNIFLEALDKNKDAIIVGSRNMQSNSIPGKSKFGHNFSNFWFRFETGIKLTDTQSGYRLYPLNLIKNIKFFTNKYEFEIEILVRAAWKNIKIINIPIRINYLPKKERVSHFRPIIDFSRVSILNTILVFITIFYIKPLNYITHIKNLKQTLTKIIHESLESNIKISSAIALGVFIGIAPIWGFQTIAAITLAYIFKLNKPITFISCNISIPPCIPIIIFLSLKTGGLILNQPLPNITLTNKLTFEITKQYLSTYIIGSIVFGLLCALLFGLITYISLSISRRKFV
jgi:glycosyltransferase involved in cell wall biosynthesis